MAIQGRLDAEWLEINSFFSEVMKIVEDAKEKACQTLEDRLVLWGSVEVSLSASLKNILTSQGFFVLLWCIMF